MNFFILTILSIGMVCGFYTMAASSNYFMFSFGATGAAINCMMFLVSLMKHWK